MKLKTACSTHCIAWVLLIVGGFNWGLVGLFNFNVVQAIFGGVPVLEDIVYVLVGLSAVFVLFEGKCKKCKG